MIEITENRSWAVRLVSALLFCCLCAVVLAPSASADTTYTYTGNPFTDFQGAAACTAGVGECRISASFTVASPLPDNLSDSLVTPLSFSITDGVHTFTELNQLNNIAVYTNSGGQIYGWYFAATGSIGPSPNDVEVLLTCGTLPCSPGLDFADFALANPSGFADNGNDPGTWTMSTTPTPEPSSLMLFGTGLLGLPMGLRRKWLGLR